MNKRRQFYDKKRNGVDKDKNFDFVKGQIDWLTPGLGLSSWPYVSAVVSAFPSTLWAAK